MSFVIPNIGCSCFTAPLVFCKLLATYSYSEASLFPDVHDSARLSNNYSSHSVHSTILGIQVKLCIGNCSSLCR